jgi:hypothetical protein
MVAAGLSPVNRVLALLLVATAVLLSAFPHLLSLVRDCGKKEVVRVNGYSAKCAVLTASASVGTGFLANVAATAVPG